MNFVSETIGDHLDCVPDVTLTNNYSLTIDYLNGRRLRTEITGYDPHVPNFEKTTSSYEIIPSLTDRLWCPRSGKRKSTGPRRFLRSVSTLPTPTPSVTTQVVSGCHGDTVQTHVPLSSWPVTGRIILPGVRSVPRSIPVLRGTGILQVIQCRRWRQSEFARDILWRPFRFLFF